MIFSLAIDWNFNPDIIKIGSFPIKYYSLMYVLAFIVGLQLMKRIYTKDNISLEKLDSIFIYTVIAMLLGARIGHYVFYEEDYTLAEVFLPFKLDPFEYTGFQGLASHGAAIGIIIAMYFYSKKVVKKPLLWTLDRLVIPTALGAMFVRLGNLFNSEIVGKATGTDFGFKFIRNDISEYKAMAITQAKTVNKAYDLIANSSRFKEVLAEVPNRYPTQIYEATGYVITFFVLWYIYWKTDKKQKHGYLFGVFMVMLWSIRFIIEFYKEWQGGIETLFNVNLNTGQLLSIPLVLVGLFFMFRPVKTV
ncbi:prolipoprotein diacylglyceryl transferase [Aureibaculum sp. A20]|uniref:Phosphatidylglycerol--prolipoprotein diacylglyceryl transferase n=1 Tax=Aureibaculum flavum TaxID=2795986 RepID=A0ABS0WLJ1_9FLAO|nr:prolipoprotein diacylglyceryl transferase [Aureibaculum flavum]MBJ2172841.1 prolipoprotein diacylglyceryl transferase [Aureibaculum flavum]